MKKTILYILQFETGIKVGITNDFQRRLKEQYLNPWCQSITKSVCFPDLSFPIEVEKKLKQYYRDKTNDGSTEFFTKVSMWDIIRKTREVGYETEKEIYSIKGKPVPKRNTRYIKLKVDGE